MAFVDPRVLELRRLEDERLSLRKRIQDARQEAKRARSESHRSILNLPGELHAYRGIPTAVPEDEAYEEIGLRYRDGLDNTLAARRSCQGTVRDHFL